MAAARLPDPLPYQKTAREALHVRRRPGVGPIFIRLIVREDVAESQPLMLPYTWSRSFKDFAQTADRFEPPTDDENTVRYDGSIPLDRSIDQTFNEAEA
jgi:hypothetical protein